MDDVSAAPNHSIEVQEAPPPPLATIKGRPCPVSQGVRARTMAFEAMAQRSDGRLSSTSALLPPRMTKKTSSNAELGGTKPHVAISIQQSSQAKGQTGSSPLPTSATTTKGVERLDQVEKQMAASTNNLLVPPAKGMEQRTLSAASFLQVPPEAIATIGTPCVAANARRAKVLRSFTQAEVQQGGADVADVRRRFRTDRTSARDKERIERPKWKLTCISEQRVLKAGVTRLHKEQVKPEVDTPVFPVRPDGSPLIMQSSFMKRLLTGKLELKGCLESDVSAAQMDVRHLNPEQLLQIREGTLDFSTDSESHSCHKNFLGMVDTQLFTKLGRQFLRGAALPPGQLFKLGIKMALVLGAQQVLNDGWAAQSKDCTADASLIPECWAAKMDETFAGHSCGIAVFSTKSGWLEVLPDENPDFQQFGKQIAVVCDRSVGSGQTRRLHWEITAMDPQVDDILKEMLRKDRGGQRQSQMELTAAIAKHRASQMSAKGLPVEKQDGPIEKGSPMPPVQISPAASHPSSSIRTAMKPRVSDSILLRMGNFTPASTVNARHPSGALDTENLRKAGIIAGRPCTRTWQNSNSTANTQPAELNCLHMPINDNEAEPLVDEKGLLQHASANFRDVCESFEDTAADG